MSEQQGQRTEESDQQRYIFTEGEYYDFCKNTFFGNNEVTPQGATKPKGAIVVTVDKLEEFK